MGLRELAVAVFGAGFGEPGADPDGVAIDDDLLPGCWGAAFAVEEEFQELDGLFEAAAGAAGGGERVGLGVRRSAVIICCWPGVRVGQVVS
ncbi:hypothetical protein ACWGKW_44155 [Streptomyces sp. NPDC054766]